jgi:hypothetical protein
MLLLIEWQVASAAAAITAGPHAEAKSHPPRARSQVLRLPDNSAEARHRKEPRRQTPAAARQEVEKSKALISPKLSIQATCI